MAALGQLVVSLTANTAQFHSAMDKAAYTSQKRMDSMVSAAKTAGTAIAGYLSISTISNIVRDTAAFGAQVDKLSRLSGVGATEFQRFAAAAKQVGIEQDKMADIFKDVQDKVGDFLQTGGGPLKDFFENIAPQIGVTAEQFKKLSGPDALQLYVSSLEKAGVTQSEMIFYMEALANDASLLVPLLQDNGRAMKEAGDEAERFGLVLDDQAIRASKEFNENLVLLEQATSGLAYQIGNALIPTLTQLSNEFIAGMKNSDGFFDALMTFGTMNPFKSQQESLKDLREELSSLEKDRERYVRAGSDTRAIDDAIATAKKRIGYLQDLQRAQFSITTMGSENDPRRGRGYVAPKLPIPKPETTKAAAKEIDRVAESIRRLEDEMLRATQGEDALLIAQARRQGATGDQITQLEKLLAQRSKLTAMDAELEEASKQFDDLARAAKASQDALILSGKNVYEDTRTPIERLNIKLAELNTLLNAGAIDWDTYSRAVFQAQDEFDDLGNKGKDTVEELTQAIEGWGKKATDTFIEFAFTGKATFGDLVNSILQDLARMMIQKNVTTPLFNAISGSAQSWIRSILPFANGGIMTNQGPVPLRKYSAGGIANSPQLALYGEAGPEAYVPLPDGRTIPVTLQGNTGGSGSTSVVVNVNVESGNADVQSQGGGAALGKAIATAVRMELINQKRPGGLLAA